METLSLDSWIRQPGNKIIALTAAVALAGGFLGWNLLIRADIRRLKSYESLKASERAKEEVLMRITEKERKLKSYEARFSETEEASWLIDDVNRLAKKSGMTLTAITPLELRTADNHAQLSLKIDGSCDYHTLGQFVSEVENARRFLKISDLRAASQTQSAENAGKLEVSMSISAYLAGKFGDAGSETA